MSSQPRQSSYLTPEQRRKLELIALLATVLTGLATVLDIVSESNQTISGLMGGRSLPFWVAILFAIFLVVYFLILRNKFSDTELEVKQLRDEVATKEGEINRLRNNQIRMIYPQEYLKILHGLTEELGEGNLLLFNVELNSFIDNNIFDSLWKRLADVPQLKQVKLALPQAKYERWKGIVTSDRAEFFAEPSNGTKFIACQYFEDKNNGEDRIAFALYEPLNPKKTNGVEDNDWAVLFPINRPLVDRRADGVCDYRHILEYRGNQRLIDEFRALWAREFAPNHAETATLKQAVDRRRKNPTPIEEILKAHNCEGERARELEQIVGAKRVVEDRGTVPSPRLLAKSPPQEDGRVGFSLRYKYPTNEVPPKEEIIEGWVTGLPSNPDAERRPCIIWATGFGDGHDPKLAQMLNRVLRKDNLGIVEIFYKKSGDIRETTCTRLYQDLKNVLNYVQRIPEVDETKICIVGISISGFLGARLASADERVSSLVMVAPPFDIIEMLDNFRKRFMKANSYPPTFDDFLKGKNNLRISDWDNNRYCNYFNHVVTSSHLVDIAVQGPPKFNRDSFLDALSHITNRARRVALVYGENDPIVDPKKNLLFLRGALDKGSINPRFMHLEQTPITHYDPEGHVAGKYPLDSSNWTQVVRKMAKAIKYCIGDVIDDGQIDDVVPAEQDGSDFPRLSVGETG